MHKYTKQDEHMTGILKTEPVVPNTVYVEKDFVYLAAPCSCAVKKREYQGYMLHPRTIGGANDFYMAYHLQPEMHGSEMNLRCLQGEYLERMQRANADMVDQANKGVQHFLRFVS